MVQAPEMFTTARLVLRRPHVADAEAIFEYASDRDAVRYMDYGTRESVAELEAVLKKRPAEWAAGQYSWVLTVKPSDRPIGTLSITVEGHAASFGYLLNPRYWGQGYATEAAQALIEWAIAQPNLYRIWATCDVDNVASARVLEKCGLVREGRLRRHTVRPNISPIPRDIFVYAWVREAP